MVSKNNLHLIWRATFGPTAASLNNNSSAHKLFNSLLSDSKIDPDFLNVADKELLNFYADDGSYNLRQLTEDERKDFMRIQRKSIVKLNLAWLDLMTNSPAQLREKIAFFWHGHFACRSNNLFFNQALLHTIRKNAIGNFGTLLKEVSHSAAMLQFLNNQQNKKNAPNENFAREVMELFTLGRGNYTEKDIKEGARAFTGWTADAKGDFIFRKNQHDTGEKTFLGQTGNFDGDEVLDIILSKPQTAKFITTKLYKYFVSENLNTKNIDWLAKRFYESNYDISSLLKDIYTSNWFYKSDIIGARIKSPIELIVGVRRLLPLEFKNESQIINMESILGQQLFYPPNVAGWPGGKSWIDSSTLMARMRLPKVFYADEILNLTPKQDDDQLMGRKLNGKEDVPKTDGKVNKKTEEIKSKVDWMPFLEVFNNTSREKLFNNIAQLVLQIPLQSSGVVQQFVNASSKETFIKSSTLQLMCTPEYQMC